MQRYNSGKPEPAGRPPLTSPPDSGFTLVEVMVAVILLTVIVSAVTHSVIISRHLTYANAQHVAAFGMAKARLDELRALDYQAVAATNFPVETGLRFSHLSGREQEPLTCSRAIQIAPSTNPVRKTVTVRVDWTFRGDNQAEVVKGDIYPR